MPTMTPFSPNATNSPFINSTMRASTNSTDTVLNSAGGTNWTPAAVIGLVSVFVVIIIAAAGWVLQIWLDKQQRWYIRDNGGDGGGIEGVGNGVAN